MRLGEQLSSETNRLSIQHLPTFASSIHSLFNPIEIMKLKHIFMFLGVMLLGLTACSKDTPNTPDLSKTLAGTEWECIIQGTEQENGERKFPRYSSTLLITPSLLSWKLTRPSRMVL